MTWTETYQKTNGNSKFSYIKLLNNNINIVSKTLILGAHDNVPCAPELRHINGPNTNIKKRTKIDKKWEKNWQYTKNKQKEKGIK